MLFYSFGTLDEFIENDLITSIQAESNRLEQIMLLYENKKSLNWYFLIMPIYKFVSSYFIFLIFIPSDS